GGGCRRPQPEQDDRADHDPEHHGTQAHLLAVMDDGVGVVGVGKGNRSDCRCGGWTAMEGPSVVVGMMLGVLRVLGRTFRHRHSRAGRNGSLRPNCRSNLGRSWLIFRKRERSNLTGWLKTS